MIVWTKSGTRSLATPPLRVALAGHPNCGKSSIFNTLTGARQHVANYPGVTVERRTGRCDLEGRPAEIVDLPESTASAPGRPREVRMDTLVSVLVVVAATVWAVRRAVRRPDGPRGGSACSSCCGECPVARATSRRPGGCR